MKLSRKFNASRCWSYASGSAHHLYKEYEPKSLGKLGMYAWVTWVSWLVLFLFVCVWWCAFLIKWTKQIMYIYRGVGFSGNWSLHWSKTGYEQILRAGVPDLAKHVCLGSLGFLVGKMLWYYVQRCCNYHYYLFSYNLMLEIVPWVWKCTEAVNLLNTNQGNLLSFLITKKKPIVTMSREQVVTLKVRLRMWMEQTK